MLEVWTVLIAASAPGLAKELRAAHGGPIPRTT
jgi:hypothetical protein